MANFAAALKTVCSLEQLAEGRTVLHRLHPLVKLTLTLVYVVTVVSFPVGSLSALMPLVLYPAVGMALSDTPWRAVLQRMALAAPFVAAAGLSNLLLDRDAVFFLSSFAVSGGMLSCLSLLVKAFLTVSAVLLLTATTPLTALTNQLARCHVPHILCLQFLLTYRYLSLLLQETERMYTAYRLRAGPIRGIPMGDMGSFLGQLFLRSFDRAERVYCAMKCRGYDGAYRSGASPALCARDIGLLLGLCALIVLPRLVNVSLLLGRLF